MSTKEPILRRFRVWIVRLLIIVLIAALFVIVCFDLVKPVREFLDSEPFAFRIGAIRFSVYTLIKIAITIFVLAWLSGFFVNFIEKRVDHIKGLRASNKALITKALQILVYFIVFLICLDILGIDLTTLSILGGAIGIGIGFGLQNITSNFISGLILLFEKSVENGDLVELADGTYGFIRYTRARYTLIETFEGREIMIPNEALISKRVTNWTHTNKKGRIRIDVGVSYDSDIEEAMELILEAAKEHPRCITNPAPICYLTEFADSSVNFLLVFWVDDITEGVFGPQSDVMRAIWKKFKDNNITIPYPQRDIYIKNPKALK